MDELYHFRDHYFETHSVEDAGRKQSDVAQEMEKTLTKLRENEGEMTEQKRKVCCYLVTTHVKNNIRTFCMIALYPFGISIFSYTYILLHYSVLTLA